MTPASTHADSPRALNAAPDALPPHCEVLVVGAGPAGSAAALTLARNGFDVVLVDQHAFPRDKICGDGLIPDSHEAMRRLGVLDAVMAKAQPATHVGMVAPRGGRMDVPGVLAVLPRRELDLILAQAAVDAGVRMHAPLRFAGCIEENGRVVGATLSSTSHDGIERTIRTTWVVIATGAVPQGLMAAGMCERQTPSGVALRGYVRNPAMAEGPNRIDMLEVVWHRALTPGYGWIFPCRDGIFNVGVGIANSHSAERDGKHAKREVNLRRVLDHFLELYPPARELMKQGEWISPIKGAPLRCTLEGARLSKPGLMVTGEAAGSTYAFTGEGIGKALETGILVAEALVAGRRRAEGDAQVRATYEASLAALKPRFDLYERANLINRFPWLADLIIWRAGKSERLMRRMSGVLNETSNPGHLLTVRGFARLFTE